MIVLFPMTISPERMKTNLDKVRSRIRRAAERSGRREDDVAIVGATKQVSAEMIRAAAAAGLTRFGENYLQEAKKKQELIDAPVEWHFIGHLQRKKVREAIERFTLIHSLDRPELAEEINRRAGEQGKTVRLLVEVNLAGEESKSGSGVAETEKLVGLTASLPHISLEGLMTMPPYDPDPERARPYFRRLRELRDALSSSLNLLLPELSMGMSTDFETAVEEGATLVRIGTALFGTRKE